MTFTKQQEERIREIAERTFPDKGSSLADLCAEAIRAALADPVLRGDQHLVNTGPLHVVCKCDACKSSDPVLVPQWRPIESAPKDGTLIIAWCVHETAKYAKDPIAEGWEAAVITRWIDHNGGGWTWHGHAGTFTHWMPLPQPPKEQTDGR